MAADEPRITSSPSKPNPPEETRLTLSPEKTSHPAVTVDRSEENASVEEAKRPSLRFLDGIQIVLVLLFAFALASISVRNTDFLLHLGTGKLLVEGRYTFGVDPFTYTAAGERWVNHSWLYDVILYELYQTVGPTVLVVLKALGLVLLAWVLLCTSRAGRSMWLPALSVAMALLALSPRLFFQPTLVSFLFLGVLLWLLQRGGHHLYPESQAEDPHTRKKKGYTGPAITLARYWPVLVLCVLWVNLDEWFVLGPVTVALYALGQWLQQKFARNPLAPHVPRPGEVRALGGVCLLSFLVCLINPHHVFAFTPPAQLGLLVGRADLASDAYFDAFFYSPLQGIYFHPAIGMSVAGMAFFPLAVLSGLSFVLNRAAWSWWRALIWAVFLGLALYHARSIALFAIVAAPIMALNFQEFAVLRFTDTVRALGTWKRWALAGRVLTVLVLVLLVAACWPGWLQAQAGRRMAWGMEIDPALEKLGKRMKELHDQGVLTEQNVGFNYTPEIANAMAWYCPEEKSFFDTRLHLFAHVAGEYVDVRKALQYLPQGTGPEAAGVPGQKERPRTNWPALLQKRKIDHVILYDPVLRRLALPLQKFTWQPEEWSLIHLDGHVAMYARQGSSLAAQGLNLEKEALVPRPEDRPPPRGPEKVPQPRVFWNEFLDPPAPSGLLADSAAVYLLLFDLSAPQVINENIRRWELGVAASTVASTGGFTGGGLTQPNWLLLKLFTDYQELIKPGRVQGGQLNLSPSEGLVYDYRNNFLMRRDQGRPAYPLLAVRACRKALAQTLDDAPAYSSLGEAYLTWHYRTQEREWAGGTLLQEMRLTQAIVALQQGLLLKPDSETMHARLADLYQRQPLMYLDMALKHRKEELRLTQENGPRFGENPKSFKERLKAMQTNYDQLRKEVQDQENKFEISSSTFKTDLERARQAMNLRLADRALNILWKSNNLENFGPAEASLVLQLLLASGRVRELQEGFGPTFEKLLGATAYHRFNCMLMASLGNYEEADRSLTKLADALLQNLPLGDRTPSKQETAETVILNPVMEGLRLKQKTVTPREFISLNVGEMILEAHLQNRLLAPWLRSPFQFQAIEAIAGGFQKWADLETMRGVLAIELGDPVKAEQHFRQALQIFPPPGSAHRLDFITRPLAEDYLRRLEQARK